MDKDYKFQKLTPSDDIKMGIYENAMEYVFTNKDLRNIAVSGAYGAGKSSMIESYKKAHPQKKFIHISLAHFLPEKNEDAEVEDKEMDDPKKDVKHRVVAALEGKIINQLVHQIDPDKISKTKFRVTRTIDKAEIRKVAILVTIFIAITCFLKFKSTWDRMVGNFSGEFLRELFSFTTTKEVELLMGTVALIILGWSIYEIIKLQKTSGLFRKINLQGNEIELFNEAKDSYFDKYLNEILYLFEQAKVDGIIFEDIDRYDTNLIFEKLREINFLLNQRIDTEIGTKGPHPMRFFYLLRDDIFISKDRTKFFDFIIPIVPVVDASNAYDQFIKHFEQGGILELFESDFLQGLSLYVDDMRILKNIYNEFMIYHEQFMTTSTEQNSNKLLAMITYKNLFPRDFGALQNGTGYVHTLFASKEKFRETEIKRLKTDIDKLETENKNISAEICENIDELNAIYFKLGGRIRVNSREEGSFSSRKDFIRAVLTSQTVQVYDENRYPRWTTINIDSEKQSMEQNPEYVKRKDLITKKSNAVVRKNERKIESLKKEIEEKEHVYLKDMISRENEQEIFSVNYVNELDEEEGFFEIKRSPYFALIKFLVREGYIDETYPDYMTYFYANSITAKDKIFLRSITDKQAKPYDYKLNNVGLIISRMRLIDFKEEESLNYELLEYLLTHKEQYEAQIEAFMYNIWNNEPAEFIAGMISQQSVVGQLAKELNEYWEGACRWILSIEKMSLENKRRYIAETLCVSSEEVIAENNSEREITAFIEKDADFLSLSTVNENKVSEKLASLKVQFEDINFETANKSLLQFVYSHNLYHINKVMIQKILKYFYKMGQEDNFFGRSLTDILSDEKQPLCAYVKENMEVYLNCLLSDTEETRDTEPVIAFVLNNTAVSEEQKKAYLETISTPIQSLKAIEDKLLWNELLEQGKVAQNEKNLCDYYFLSDNGMDERLVSYINSFENYPLLQTKGVEDGYEEGAVSKLFRAIVRTNSIQNDKYKGTICSFNRVFTGFDIKEISSEKMDILIANNILKMNSGNLTFMRENYPEKCMPYIIKNIAQYVEIMDEESFSSEELLKLLDEKISDDLKLQLLQFEEKPISIRGRNYSSKVQEYILENLYCEEDLELLVQWYPENRQAMRNIIFNIATESVEQILSSSYKLHEDLFEQLVQSDEITLENKTELLANHIRMGMEQAAVMAALKHMGLSAYENLLQGKRPKIPVTGANEKLLEVLRAKGWISSFEVDRDNPKYFSTFGKRVRKS